MKGRRAAQLAVAFFLFTRPALPQDGVRQSPALVDLSVTSSAVVGEEKTHVIEPGDTLARLAARHGVDARVLAAENALLAGASLKPGGTLRVTSRHLVPRGSHEGILINIPQRHLFYFRNGTLAAHYPIAVGRHDWRTPTGEFHLAAKETDPTWEVPRSIQEEMRRNGKPVTTAVPPGPDNPLGGFWLGLNRTGVGIHGTNSPNSIYRSATHGCIRMNSDDIEELFNQVEVGTPVTMIYQPVLFGIAEDGIYLEAHADVYRKGGDPVAMARRLATEAGVEDGIDWESVKQLLARREGIARRVAPAR